LLERGSSGGGRLTRPARLFHDEGYGVDDHVHADNRLKYGDSVQYELTL